MATKVMKMCNLSASLASFVFKQINSGNVELVVNKLGDQYIVTDIEPKDLIYPEGWYYAKGAFRNKHTSTTGIYEEIHMIKSNGEFWTDYARYCTLRT